MVNTINLATLLALVYFQDQFDILTSFSPNKKKRFYVNTFTKKSQWDKPTEPARPPQDDDAPPGPPPAYRPGDGPAPTDAKNNPFTPQSTGTAGGGASSSQVESDAELARRLQEEEDARARGNGPSIPEDNKGGASAEYLNSAPQPGVPSSSLYPQQLPPREESSKSRGLLGKLFGNKSKTSGGYPAQAGYGYGGYGAPTSQAASPQGYVGGGRYGYGYGGQGYGPSYGGGYYQQRPQRSGGGIGPMGGAALGLGAGLVGGMLLEDAIDDHDQQAYDQGYQDGQDNDFDGGDDFGGGDF